MQCKTQTADCGLQNGVKMQTKGKIQTGDQGKMQDCSLQTFLTTSFNVQPEYHSGSLEANASISLFTVCS